MQFFIIKKESFYNSPFFIGFSQKKNPRLWTGIFLFNLLNAYFIAANAAS